METAREIKIYENINVRKIFTTNKRRTKRFNFTNYVVILTFFFAISFFQVCQQALIAEDAVQISNLKSDIRLQKNMNEKKRIEGEVLKSPGRIEQLAMEQGMIKPVDVEFLVLESEIANKVKETDEKKGLIASIYSKWNR